MSINEQLKADPVKFITDPDNKDIEYMYIPSGNPVFIPNRSPVFNMFTYVELGKYEPSEKNMAGNTYKFKKLLYPLPFESLSTLKKLEIDDTHSSFIINDPSTSPESPYTVVKGPASVTTARPLVITTTGKSIPGNRIPGEIIVNPKLVSSPKGKVIEPANVSDSRYGSGGRKTNKRKTNKRKTNKRKANKRKTNKRKTNKK
jgi:hypothetical protein